MKAEFGSGGRQSLIGLRHYRDLGQGKCWINGNGRRLLPCVIFTVVEFVAFFLVPCKSRVAESISGGEESELFRRVIMNL